MPDVAPPASSEAPGNPFAPLARSVGYSGTLPDLGGKVSYPFALRNETPVSYTHLTLPTSDLV